MRNRSLNGALLQSALGLAKCLEVVEKVEGDMDWKPIKNPVRRMLEHEREGIH